MSVCARFHVSTICDPIRDLVGSLVKLFLSRHASACATHVTSMTNLPLWWRVLTNVEKVCIVAIRYTQCSLSSLLDLQHWPSVVNWPTPSGNSLHCIARQAPSICCRMGLLAACTLSGTALRSSIPSYVCNPTISLYYSLPQCLLSPTSHHARK